MTPREGPTRRLIGILTEDFRLYHDLVAGLKERDVPFLSLSYARAIPREVAAVITSPAEAGRVKHRQVVAAGDAPSAIATALQLLQGTSRFRDLVVGVDPGPAPVVAFLGDHQVIDVQVASTPEAVADLVGAGVHSFAAETVRVRVGHGNPTNRNRTINALAGLGVPIEIVDEKGTTHRTRRPDLQAAIGIARTAGQPAAGRYDVRPTAGEVREVQRLSRLQSGGRLSISAESARRVARGELSLDEAIDRHGATTRRRG